MLYIVIGSAVVSILSMFNGGANVLYALYFDKGLILQGQVWRLFTYIFTSYTNGIYSLIFLYFFYMFGKFIEQSMGTFRFNLFYFSGVILMDVFAMIFFPAETQYDHLVLYLQMATFMHLSMVLTFAAMRPDSQFLILFILPVKAWVLSLVYIVIIAAQVYNASAVFPCNLLPLVGLANFLLFSGKDVLNLLPPSWRPSGNRRQKPPQQKKGPIPFDQGKKTKDSGNYTHKCTVCGRTDVTNPELEFRYCSRCNGYHCYCQDHINNHTHIE